MADHDEHCNCCYCREEPKPITKGAIKVAQKFLKAKAKDYAQANDKLQRRFMSELDKGKSYEEAMELICEAFDCTPRRVKNQLAKMTGSLNPATKALNEAKFVGYLNGIEARIDDQVNELDEQIDSLDELESEGVGYYELEVTETQGDRETKVVTKKVPIPEARNILLKRSVEALKGYSEAVGKLRGNQTLVNINNGSILDQLNNEDLDREIANEEARYQKNPDVKP